MKVLERDIQAMILEWLNYLPGVRAWRRNVGSRVWQDKNDRKRVMFFGVKGQSDIWGFAGPHGTHLEIEVKRPGDTPSDDQSRWLEDMQAAGVIAFWCDSFESCQEQLLAEYRKRGWAYWP